LSGLSLGETVVTDGQVRLNPGTKVYFHEGTPTGLESMR
jgi:hypothetical protein